MSTITDIWCVLTQEALDALCEAFHIPEEVHPTLPCHNNTMYESPAGKIGLYTRFFDFANFRLLLSSFLVDVLRYFCINISQLSVIGAAKVSHFEILCRVCGVVPTVGLFWCFYVNSKKNGWVSFSKRSDHARACYTKPLDSLKNWNNRFFWVDEFACPARFPWHTAKNVVKDHAPIAGDLNPQDYNTLVAHPSPFWKYSEPFLCLVGLSRHYTLDVNTYPMFLYENGEGMDLFSFIHTPDPTKVKVAERGRREGEPPLLETTIGRTVPLLPVAPARAEGELEESPVSKAVDTTVEDVAPLQLRRQRKRKVIAVDASEASYPPKTLRKDDGAPSGASVGGKSASMVQRLLVGAVQNLQVGVAALPTLPFVTSYVSATLEREGGDNTDSVTGANLRTVGASQRFIISSDSSHHSGVNVAEAEVESLIRSSAPVITTTTTVTTTVDAIMVIKETVAKSSLFAAGSSSAGEAEPTPGGFSNCTGSDFLVSGIRTVIDPDSVLQKVYIPWWNVTNGSHLDDGGACREMEAEAIRLRAQASQFKNVEKSLRDEVRTLTERNTSLEKEKGELDVKVADLAALVKVREQEAADLDVVVTSVKSQNDMLVDQVHELEISSAGLKEKVMVYEHCMEQLKKFQDDRMKEVTDKFKKLNADVVEMVLYLEERFYPHLLTTISSRRWLLTHDMKLAIAKCLNSTEYLSALGATIGKAIEKGMQDGLSAGITHGAEGRTLTDVAAYNPSAEAEYLSALQCLQCFDFPLTAELNSNKDANIETVMNLLRLEDNLAKKLGLIESQPHVDQLMVLIHHSSDHRVIGASALSLSLDVSSFKPLSITALTGTEDVATIIPTTVDTTTALSVTFASTSVIIPIYTNDYEIVHADARGGKGVENQVAGGNIHGNVNPFPNVDDVDMNI
ncbi:hypothetical protein Tco_0295246 [Tanacetum coccineum]